MKSKLAIVVDDREAASAVSRELSGREDCDVSFRRLRLGDYQVGGRLLFERKTLRDLVASIADGRVFRQACQLAAGPLRPVILLEGRASDLADIGMSREAIQGALISITLILGLPLLRARDAEESARLMVYAGRQMQTLITEGVPRAGARPKSKRHIQLHILQGLPGVGPVRARRLLEKYGSISVALSATVDELAQLPGIGKGIADKIRWAVNEPPPGYLDGPVI